MSSQLQQLRRAVAQQLEALHRAGVTHIAKPRAVAPPAAAIAEAVTPSHFNQTSHSAETSTMPSRQQEATRAPQKKAAPDRPSAQEQLEIIRGEVAACTQCAELSSTRTQTVFGVGNPTARLCFLGESPGADEDRQGEPFVGRAGQLLTKIIEACRMSRQDVYILNVLKCRPPGNRNPLPDEAANCRGFLNRQLDAIQPEFICCLGAVAARELLETTEPIGKLRGRFFDYRGIRVMCTYHPAYLLRNPAAKRDVWEDMQMLMKEMGVELE
ncbi:MAG: uracil-DNA glycosylase [Pirellulales bacterium]